MNDNLIYDKPRSQGVANVIKRAHQLLDLKWSPIYALERKGAFFKPSRTGINLLPETCGELAKIPNIVAIKEAGGDVRTVSAIHSCAGEDFTVYSGNDDVILPTLACGGKGVISVLSNILPGAVTTMCKSFFIGELEVARLLQKKYAKLISLLFCETNPIPVKYALHLMGMGEETTRLPLWNMSDANKEKLKAEMEKLHII